MTRSRLSFPFVFLFVTLRYIFFVSLSEFYCWLDLPMTYCLLMAFLAFSSFFVNLTLRWLMWMMAWMIRFVRYEIWMQMNECEMKFHLEVGQESALSRQCSCLLAAGQAAAPWRHNLAYLEWETHISSLAADVAATRSSIRCGMTKAWTSYFLDGFGLSGSI